MHRNPSSSLRKQFLIIALLATIPILGLIVWIGFEQRQEAVQDVRQSTQQLTILGARDLNTTIQSTHHVLQAIAQLDAVRKHQPAACTALLANLIQEYPGYQNMAAAAPDGQLFCSAIPPAAPVSIADRLYFQQAISTRRFVIGEYLVSRVTGKPSLVLAYPALDDAGNPLAVVTAALDLSVLDQSQLVAQSIPGSSVIVIDRQGTILARSPSSETWIGKSLPDHALVNLIMTQRSGVQEVNGLDGVRRLYAFTSIGENQDSLFITVGIPMAIALAPANMDLVRNLVILGIFALLAILAIIFFGNTNLVKPIHTLSEVAHRFGSGDLNARVETDFSAKEMNQLAHDFNDMAASLQASTSRIREAENRFRTLVEQIPAITYRSLADANNARLYISPQTVNILGYPPEDWLDDNHFWLDHVHAEDRQRVAGEWQQFIMTGGEWFSHYRMIAADNRVIWFRDQARLVQTLAESPGILQGVMLDITEREQIGDALRRERDLLGRIMETSPVGIVVLDGQGQLTFTNPEAEKIFNLPPREFPDRSMSQIVPNLRDFQGKPIPVTSLPFFKVMDTGKPVKNLSLKYAPSQGDRSPEILSIDAAPLIDPDGANNGVVAMIQDITQQVEDQQKREQQQEDYGVIFNAVPAMIWYIDTGSRVIRVNEAAAKTAGQPAASLVGKCLEEIFPGEAAITWSDLQAVLSTGESQFGIISSYPRVGGEKGWAVIDRIPYRDPEGKILGVIVFMHDITEQRQRERELGALASVAAALRTAMTRVEIEPIILSQVLTLLEAEGALFAVQDPATGEISLENAVGAWAPALGRRIPPKTGISGQVMESGQPYFTNQAAEDPVLVRSYFIGNLQSAACVPLITQQQTHGLLWVGKETEITPNDMRVLTVIADISASAMHRAALLEQTQLHLQRLIGLHSIDMAITGSLDPRVTMSLLLDQVTAQLHVDAADVLLLEPELQQLEYAGGRGFSTPYFQGVSLNLGKGYAGRVAAERKIIHVPDLSAAADQGLAQTIQNSGEGFQAYFAAPLIAKGQVKGVLEVFHRTPFYPDTEWADFLETLATQAAIAVDNADLFERLQRSNDELALAYDATIEGWSHALELRDYETQGHSRRVTDLSLRLARKLNFSDPELAQFRRGVLLHDIGKMAIPDEILLKPGPLTSHEWEIMRRHPSYAYDLLSPIPYLRQALDVPYAHHERWNGSGYPRGLKGDQIPVSARVFAVVDVWDALISDRPYRKAWPAEKVRDYLCSLSGIEFDPKVVKAFLWLQVDHGVEINADCPQ